MATQKEIHEKGFDLSSNIYAFDDGAEFGKIKVGTKSLDDAIFDITQIKTRNPIRNNPFLIKGTVIKALLEKDIPLLCDISRFYYKYSGIYERTANFFATLYRYDWYTVPEIYDDTVKQEKVLKDFSTMLNLLDDSYIQKMCGEIALTVIVDGCYYGYIADVKGKIILQQLPTEYCRVRYYVDNMPAVEFNMAFFDTFKDINYRMRILNLFPEDFKKGYLLFK